MLLPFHTDTVSFGLGGLDTRGVENCPILMTLRELAWKIALAQSLQRGQETNNVNNTKAFFFVCCPKIRLNPNKFFHFKMLSDYKCVWFLPKT